MRYRLRTLLILVTAACIAFALIRVFGIFGTLSLGLLGALSFTPTPAALLERESE